MKSRRIMFAALAAAVAAGLTLGGRAQAISTGAEQNPPPQARPGQQQSLPAPITIVAISPETTVFQFRVPHRDPATGKTQVNTITDLGTTVVAEKLFYLPSNVNRKKGPLSSATLGAWYWYHNSKVDRLSLYGKYFYDNRVGVQFNAGGDTHLGLFEYYAFVLYNAKNQSQTSPVGIQLGLGPYVSRRNAQTETFSGGDTGITGLFDLSYTQSTRISYSGEIWYVNYHAPARDFGISTTDSLLRFYVGVNYKL